MLLQALRDDGYQLIGPACRDGAIVRAGDDLPAGWTAEHKAGAYRLAQRDDEALFDYAVGPQSSKQVFSCRA